MQISRGIVKRAQKVVIYGPEGIGKSTFASKFPNTVFIDTEGSTYHMDVARTPKPSSWSMLLQQVQYFKANPYECETLVIDTADWAEQLCMEELCARSQKDGIEGFGYGKGYVYLAEEFGRLLNLLEELVELGINVVFTAHAQMRKFEQPDEAGAYDRWEMKLQKKTAPLVKEWADIVLFANFKTYVVNVDGQGTAKGKNKAQGGKRVIYTTHHPCWDAKNRHDLKPELSLDYNEIAHCIVLRTTNTSMQPSKPPAQQDTSTTNKPAEQTKVVEQPKQESKQLVQPPKQEPPKNNELQGVPKSLADLMIANNVTVEEIQEAVASRGYYPEDTPIENYDPDFIAGVLVGAWSQVFSMIQEFRTVPF